MRLAHTDCLGEKRDEEKTTHALLSSLSMHAAQISSCFRFGLLITRSMGCAASRAPGGETRTRRFPPSMKPRRLLCCVNPESDRSPTHTSEGRCAHTAGFLSLPSACVGFQRSGRSARFRDSVLHASALTLLQRSCTTCCILGSGYAVRAGGEQSCCVTESSSVVLGL